MFVRNVGHLMTNPAILYTAATAARKRSPKAFMDAVVTTTIALHDLKRTARRRHPQLAQGLGLHRQAQDARPGRSGVCRRAVRPRGDSCWACRDSTVKLGIMDEERRTSVNLKACIAAASEPRGLHQHRLPGPHRRRDAHRHAGRPDDPQGGHEDQRLDRRLREEQRAGRPGVAACAARRRSARACGPCPT